MNHSLAIGSGAGFRYRAMLKSLLRIGRYPKVDLTVTPPRFFSCAEQGPNPLLSQSNRTDIRRRRSAERCCKSPLFPFISTSAFVQPNCPLRITLITYDLATREGWNRACCTDGRKYLTNRLVLSSAAGQSRGSRCVVLTLPYLSYCFLTT